MQDNTTKQSKKGSKNTRPAIYTAGRLLAYLAGNPAEICTMMGVRHFEAIVPTDQYIGGVTFEYNPILVSNQSRQVRILAENDKKCRIEWYSWPDDKPKERKLVDSADDVSTERLELTWWEHTGCAVRRPWVIDIQTQKFELGEVVVTSEASTKFTNAEIGFCLQRHARGDWGNACKDTKEANNAGLDKENPDRLLSVYNFPDGRTLWLITEWDRSVTTALLPDDY